MTPLRRWFLPLVLALLLGAGALLATSSGTSAATVPTPAAPAATHVLNLSFGHTTVHLTVPRSWHVSRTMPTAGCGCGSDFRPVCIVAKGDYDHDPYRCELVVGGGLYVQDFDQPVPSWRLSRCGDWDTTYEADGQLGRWPAEFRIFLDRCHSRKAEQWMSVTSPSIGLWHPLSWGADDRAAAKAAASLGVSGPIAAKRLWDVGLVRRVQVIHGRAYVTIDRVVHSLDGHWLNESRETYRYRLSTPSHATTWPHCTRDWSVCTATQLRRQFAKGTHPTDGTPALAGRPLAVVRSPEPGSTYAITRMASHYRFVSSGDPGHCGC